MDEREEIISPLDSILLSIAQVCRYLGGISEAKIRELVSTGRMPAPVKLDRVARWRRGDLDQWAENLPCPKLAQ
jgi:excisionase family DNA binding protein